MLSRCAKLLRWMLQSICLVFWLVNHWKGLFFCTNSPADFPPLDPQYNYSHTTHMLNSHYEMVAHLYYKKRWKTRRLPGQTSERERAPKNDKDVAYLISDVLLWSKRSYAGNWYVGQDPFGEIRGMGGREMTKFFPAVFDFFGRKKRMVCHA